MVFSRPDDTVSQLNLPPGFRFFPTDEELLVQYLCRKVAGHHFPLKIIGEVDLYKFDPWDLPCKAMFGEKEWFFFSPRDRKYPNGSRPNRVAGSGYWKATGTDKIITAEGIKVGIKKSLVFYQGKAPKDRKPIGLCMNIVSPNLQEDMAAQSWMIGCFAEFTRRTQANGASTPPSLPRLNTTAFWSPWKRLTIASPVCREWIL